MAPVFQSPSCPFCVVSGNRAAARLLPAVQPGLAGGGHRPQQRTAHAERGEGAIPGQVQGGGNHRCTEEGRKGHCFTIF